MPYLLSDNLCLKERTSGAGLRHLLLPLLICLATLLLRLRLLFLSVLA